MKNFKSGKKIELIKVIFFKMWLITTFVEHIYKIKFPAFTYSKNYGNKDSLYLVNWSRNIAYVNLYIYILSNIHNNIIYIMCIFSVHFLTVH